MKLTLKSKGVSVVMGLNEELLLRAQEVARNIKKQGIHSLPVDLLGQNDDKHVGLISDSDIGLIVIGSFEAEGTRFYIGLSAG